MIESMLVKYNINDSEDFHRAIREIMQEIALAGLYRRGFLKKQHSMKVLHCAYSME